MNLELSLLTLSKLIVLTFCFQSFALADVQLNEKSITIDDVEHPLDKSIEVIGVCRATRIQGTPYGREFTILGLKINQLTTQTSIVFSLFSDQKDQNKLIKTLAVGNYYKLRGRIINANISGLNRLVVLKIETLEAIDPKPLTLESFEGRSASFEGITSGKSTITLAQDVATVSGINTWPEAIQGKKVTVTGTIMKEKQAWIIRNAKWNPVELADMLKLGEAEITLDGKLWSLNGHWWFSYRGESLYLTHQNGPPMIFPTNQHGSDVTVTGSLVQQLRPSLEQISHKTDRDLVPTCVIRGAKVTYHDEEITMNERFGYLYKTPINPIDGVPLLIAKPSHRRNILGNETTAMLYADRNYKSIQKILKENPLDNKNTLAKRMNDESEDETIRLLYATLLARVNDDRGRQFLLKSYKKNDSKVGDVLYCLGIFPFIGNHEKIVTEVSWAEDILIGVINNKKDGKLAFQYSSISKVLEIINTDKTRTALLNYALKNTDKKRHFFSMPTAVDSLCSPRTNLPAEDLLRLEKVYTDKNQRRTIMKALLRLKSPEVAKLFAKDLTESFVYMDIRDNLSPEVLKGYEKLLPSLEGEAKTNVQMLLILGLKDPTTEMIKLLEGGNFSDPSLLLYELKNFKDTRSIIPAVNILQEAPNDYFGDNLTGIGHALEVIFSVGNRDSVNALISLLATDLGRFGNYIDKEGYQRIIAAHLINITGESFGTDQAKWAAWEKLQPDDRFKSKKSNALETFRKDSGGRVDLER